MDASLAPEGFKKRFPVDINLPDQGQQPGAQHSTAVHMLQKSQYVGHPLQPACCQSALLCHSEHQEVLWAATMFEHLQSFQQPKHTRLEDERYSAQQWLCLSCRSKPAQSCAHRTRSSCACQYGLSRCVAAIICFGSKLPCAARHQAGCPRTGLVHATEKVGEFAASGFIFKDTVEVVTVEDSDGTHGATMSRAYHSINTTVMPQSQQPCETAVCSAGRTAVHIGLQALAHR